MTGFDQVKFSDRVSYRCWYHVAWCPKWRRKVLTSDNSELGNPPIDGDPGAVDTRLAQIIQELADETGSEVASLIISPDSVQLVVSVSPQFGISKFARQAKARSSGILREEFPSLRRRLPTLWTNAYFVATVGEPPTEAIEQYIEAQKNV